MSPRFPDELHIKWIGATRKGRALYQLLADFSFRFELDGESRGVIVPAGFETDFASIPRLFWRVFPPSGRYAPASVIHDWLYKNRIGEVPGDPDTRTIAREQADRIFLEGMKALGVSGFKRSLIFRAVRTFGGRGWGS